MIELKLTNMEFESLIESNSDRYWITACWSSRPYTVGKRPKEVNGVARILKAIPHK